MKKAIYAGLVLLLLGLWYADRRSLKRAHADAKALAFEDALSRQLAVMEREPDATHCSVRESRQGKAEELDLIVLFTVSDQLKRLWQQEDDINQGHCERPTVSGKRLLAAVDCHSVGDFEDFLERRARQFYWKGEFFPTDFFELPDEQMALFNEFIERSLADEVAEGSDPQALIENAPDGEYRMF